MYFIPLSSWRQHMPDRWLVEIKNIFHGHPKVFFNNTVNKFPLGYKNYVLSQKKKKKRKKNSKEKLREAMGWEKEGLQLGVIFFWVKKILVITITCMSFSTNKCKPPFAHPWIGYKLKLGLKYDITNLVISMVL